jgi:hypothetical protein
VKIVLLVFLLKVSIAFGQPLDLSEYNFETDEITNLNGQWEFYWGELLGPTDSTHNRSK